MNLIFKSIITITMVSSLQARDLYLVTYKVKNSALKQVQQLLERKVPKNMIEYRESDRPCQKLDNKPILHICLGTAHNFDVVTMNKEVLSRSMRVFNGL